jgi:RNA polymerase sigma factor (sigma-70 family)
MDEDGLSSKQDGNAKLFDEWFPQSVARTHYLLLRKYGNGADLADIEDAIANASLKILKIFHSLEAKGVLNSYKTFQSYFSKVAENYLKTSWKDNRRQVKIKEYSKYQITKWREAITPEEAFEYVKALQKETLTEIEFLITNLFYEGFTLKEIGEMIGRSHEAVRQIKSRAKRKFQSGITPERLRILEVMMLASQINSNVGYDRAFHSGDE